MAAIGHCEMCGSRGCFLCNPKPEELLRMRRNALEDLSDGSSVVGDLVMTRAARSGMRPSDERPERTLDSLRKVKVPCVYCQELSVLDWEECGLMCMNCKKLQPVEFIACVHCGPGIDFVKKTIEGLSRCLLCEREQPTESNVVPIR